MTNQQGALQYADRDHTDLGSYYMRHVSAMTGEALHSKSAIAAELAHRDREIDRLQAENTALQQGYTAARLEIESLQARIKTMAEEHADELMVAHLDGRMRGCSTEPAGEYPPLPGPHHHGPTGTGSYFDSFTADQMRAYVDADRAMRAAQPAGAQQPGTAYAELPSYEHQRAIMEAERNASLDEYSRIVLLTSTESRIYERAFTNGWNRRASHGQAPAQAAPAAVAGPSEAESEDVKRARHIAAVAQRWSGDRTHLGALVHLCDLVWALKTLAAAPTTQPAPQQEPVAWFHSDFGAIELSRIRRVGWKPLYAAPQPSPASQGDALSRAARDVLAERRRQVEVEGFDAEHDGEAHDGRDLAEAAACYLLCDSGVRPLDRGAVQGLPHGGHLWPWEPRWWKPKDEYQNLKRAAALVLARMDQLNGADADRAARPPADSALKDHQTAALVNELRDIAIQYCGTQQLRERIARAVIPALKAQAADSVLEDAELGRIAMRFVDRAGDPHPGIDDAETICREFYTAMSAVLDPRFQRRMDAARKQGANHD